MVFSADDEWLASWQDDSVSVGAAGEEARYRITNATFGEWSPSGAKLAVIGNICAGFDALVFDPTTGTLDNVTESLDLMVLKFVWRPDGSALTTELIPRGGGSSFLGEIDLSTQGMEVLLTPPIQDELSPVQWNPTGDKLLFHFGGGRGICEDDADSFSPPPDQTTVELLTGQ